MNNSQKTVYIIAVIAIIILIASGIYSTRIYNGFSLKNNVMISLNTPDGHGVTINQDVKPISFESGLVYDLTVSDFPNPEDSTISIAIPINNLKPNTTYSAEMKFRMYSNTPLPVTVKTNSNITIEQTSFETDIDFKPVTLAEGNNEYVIEINFDTNDEGTGYVIFDFGVNETIDQLNVRLSNVIISEFKEQEDDNVDSEQTSETSIEII